ncbi:GGDEF domain-containing protein [Vibrio aquaticus]|uniref:diguanylate cyclase n=1 Tax=Vibrio aquaticus TaxID=2496559 RepID=A0A432CYU0_9VIBR|nr:GGDEF domain-containing protein [Vibrio aquaticus]RTZ16626.1 GGDEF domain-containing protein [Vibrio aquaticus]
MKVIHKVIFGLVIITILIVQLYWLHGGSLVYRISPEHFRFLATNDQVQGGSSTSELAYKGEQATLSCELSKTPDYAWPYCGVSIQLTDKIYKGIDFSSFHTVRLNIDFDELDSERSASLRFYMRNYNAAYSKPDNEYTLKYNGLEYSPGVGNGDIDIPIANLQVLTWWLSDNQIPIQHSAPEYTNITLLELATGSGHSQGEFKMTINSIELVGHYISAENLAFSLLTFWVCMALVYSVVEIRRSHNLILRSHFRQDHLSRLNKELKEQNIHFAELANRDALTGAMNRHSIREWLDSAYADSTGKRLSVLYLDIDHFKSVNDLYGHSMGDDILREFTMVVLSTLSSSERLVRWGGEEFVVFCPGRDIEEISQLAEQVRRRVESHIWVHGDPLTTSIGVASLGDERVNEMLTRADEALYKAKRQGRNRVVVSH